VKPQNNPRGYSFRTFVTEVKEKNKIFDYPSSSTPNPHSQPMETIEITIFLIIRIIDGQV
jgi:hypothetical protein